LRSSLAFHVSLSNRQHPGPIEKDAAKHGKICSVKVHALKKFRKI